MKRAWPFVAIAVAAAAAALVWPLTPAIPTRDTAIARVTAAVLAILTCTTLAKRVGAARPTVILIGIVPAALALLLLVNHFDAVNGCIADFESRPVIIGTVYTADVQPYLARNPGLSPADLLFDAGGVPERVWTAGSIRTCRLRVSWGGLLAIPLLALSACAIVRVGRFALGPRTPPVAAGETGPRGESRYDAFISYRHVEPDRTMTLDLVDTLESRGLRVAIDARDFRPNEHFLSEMERCIRQSRFVLCLVTPAYVQSDHTAEEAIISKTLDLADRRKRLVPLLYERVELPVWLHGLVGIDFTAGASVDPHDRLVALLARDQRDATSVR